MTTTQITKQEFKKIYFDYGRMHPGTGWTADYWEHFYEHGERIKYEVTEPEFPNADVMWVSDGSDTKRIFFLSEDETENFYDFPLKTNERL